MRVCEYDFGYIVIRSPYAPDSIYLRGTIGGERERQREVLCGSNFSAASGLDRADWDSETCARLWGVAPAHFYGSGQSQKEKKEKREVFTYINM